MFYKTFSAVSIYRNSILLFLIPLAGEFLLQAPIYANSSGETIQTAKPAASVDSSLPVDNFDYGDAFALGIVEGVTEFLPISSTGHLILAKKFLGFGSDTRTGGSINSAVDAYIIVIQAGAIAAVLFLYWGKIVTILLGIQGKSREGLLLGRNLLAAFIPAVVIGLTLEDMVDKYLFNHWPVIVALAAGAVLMLGVESWRARRSDGFGGPEADLHELTIRQSLLIGLLQCVALWPGTSRSMMAIVGGYMAGLSPRRAAEFSFLLGLPTLGGAAFYKGLKYGPEIITDLGWGPMSLGFVVAAVSAAISVKWLVGYLGRHGLALFAWYRIALAVILALIVF